LTPPARVRATRSARLALGSRARPAPARPLDPGGAPAGCGLTPTLHRAPYAPLPLGPRAAGAGSLDYRELKCCLRALGVAQSAAQLAAHAAEFDREQTGRISFAAIQEIAGRAYADAPAEQRLADAFALFDEDGAGRIGRRELKRVCRDAGLPVGDDEIDLMLGAFDADGDGAIGLDDFRAVYAEAMTLGGF
jgi:Ca2+-binding EF-hand superfamily protein